MANCAVCGNHVDWSVVKEEFYEFFLQADALGVECLTEEQQTVLEGKICSIDCYKELG